MIYVTWRPAIAESGDYFLTVVDPHGLDLAHISKQEVLCPASIEAGQRATCESCKLCAGASVRAKSIAIVAHGTSKRAAMSNINQGAI